VESELIGQLFTGEQIVSICEFDEAGIAAFAT
jgi:hypothetical protein